MLIYCIIAGWMIDVKKILSISSVLLITSVLVTTGCGFKSDLYLPNRADSISQLDAPELPPLPSLEDLSNPGVPIEIPPLSEELPLKQKKK